MFPVRVSIPAVPLGAILVGASLLVSALLSEANAANLDRDPLGGSCWVSEVSGRPISAATLAGRDAILDPADPNRVLVRGATERAPAIAAIRAPCSRSPRVEREEGLDPAVLAEINAARADPRAYAARLRAYLGDFRGRVVEEPGHREIMTVEGPAAVEEAIADLERRSPAPPLTANSALARVARDLLEDQGESGRTGHVGSDGSTLSERMRRGGVFAMAMEEDIAYGGSTPVEVVRQLIVDDGVRDRGHRQSIFDPHMSHAAVACGPHSRWGWMCVVDLAGGVMASPGSERGR